MAANMKDEEVVSILNGLIHTCKDGENGFRTAMGGVQDKQLKSLFNQYASQRGQFAAELQAEVAMWGGSPETHGSAAAALHRGWINIKSAVTGRNEEAIISECERGEDAAVLAYQEALNRDLPAEVRALIQRQYEQVKEAHDRIRALERAAERNP